MFTGTFWIMAHAVFAHPRHSWLASKSMRKNCQQIDFGSYTDSSAANLGCQLGYTPIGDQVTFEDMSGKAPGLAFRHFFSLRFKPNPAREYSITVDRQNLDGPRSQSLCQFDQVRDSGRKLQSSPINVLLPRRCAREWHRATGPTIHCSILPQ